MVKGRLDRPGSNMYFDEFIGKTRISGRWTVLEAESASRIIFKANRLIPVYLNLAVHPKNSGVTVEHTLSVGFKSNLLEPLNRIIAWLFFTPLLKKELIRHVGQEFKFLEELL